MARKNFILLCVFLIASSPAFSKTVGPKGGVSGKSTDVFKGATGKPTTGKASVGSQTGSAKAEGGGTKSVDLPTASKTSSGPIVPGSVPKADHAAPAVPPTVKAEQPAKETTPAPTKAEAGGRPQEGAEDAKLAVADATKADGEKLAPETARVADDVSKVDVERAISDANGKFSPEALFKGPDAKIPGFEDAYAKNPNDAVEAYLVARLGKKLAGDLKGYSPEMRNFILQHLATQDIVFKGDAEMMKKVTAEIAKLLKEANADLKVGKDGKPKSPDVQAFVLAAIADLATPVRSSVNGKPSVGMDSAMEALKTRKTKPAEFAGHVADADAFMKAFLAERAKLIESGSLKDLSRDHLEKLVLTALANKDPVHAENLRKRGEMKMQEILDLLQNLRCSCSRDNRVASNTCSLPGAGGKGKRGSASTPVIKPYTN